MDRVAIEVLAASDAPAWDAFLSAHARGAVFLTRRWMEIIGEIFDVQPQLVVATTGGGILGGIPLFLRKRGFLRVSPPPPITLYNGAVIRPDIAPDAAADLLAHLLRRAERHCHFIALSLPPGLATSPVFRERGWRVLPQETIIVDIADYTQAWQHFNQSLRRKIRRAEEHALVFSETRDAETVLHLHRQSYARHSLLPPIPIDRLRAWLSILLQEGLARMYSASLPYSGAAAARVVLPAGDILYDWLAGADITQTDIAASHWLVAKILQRHASLGQTRFDFMGANTPGVTDFKRNFGGRFEQYATVTWYRSAIVHSIETLRNALRQRQRNAT